MGGMFKPKTKEELEGLNHKLFIHNDLNISDYSNHLYRVLKEGSHCYIMSNDSNLKDMINEFSNVGFIFIKLLVWDKQNKICNQWYMNQCEYILFFRKGHTKKINNCGDSNLISISNIANKKNGHPTEKPVELMKKLIVNPSNVGDTILDPFVGVGATPLDCLQSNRNFIGSEIDNDYYNKTIQRLNSSYPQS